MNKKVVHLQNKVVHKNQKPGGALAEFVIDSDEFLPTESDELTEKSRKSFSDQRKLMQKIRADEIIIFSESYLEKENNENYHIYLDISELLGIE